MIYFLARKKIFEEEFLLSNVILSKSYDEFLKFCRIYFKVKFDKQTDPHQPVAGALRQCTTRH